MDLRTGRTYETRDDAIAAGVPDSDIAEVIPTADWPIVRFSSGPFKNRTYRRHPETGQLVRTDR